MNRYDEHDQVAAVVRAKALECVKQIRDAGVSEDPASLYAGALGLFVNEATKMILAERHREPEQLMVGTSRFEVTVPVTFEVTGRHLPAAKATREYAAELTCFEADNVFLAGQRLPKKAEAWFLSHFEADIEEQTIGFEVYE